MSNESEISPARKYGQKALELVESQCLPLGLVLSLFFGLLVPVAGATIGQKGIMSYICITLIFLISGLKLNTKEAMLAVKAQKSILFGITSIMVMTSMLGSFLTTLVPLEPAEFKTGMIIFFCTPCAIAYSVILTKQAGGNVALAIFLVVSSNILGAFITPLTLSLFVRAAGGLTLPIGDLVAQLVGTIFAPLVVGKAIQEIPVRDHMLRRAVGAYNKTLTLFSNFLVSCIPWMKISESAQKGTFARVRGEDVCSTAAWFLAVHLLFLMLNFILTTGMREDLTFKKALVMTASTKTLPVTVTIISLLPPAFGDPGLLALPAIICQFVQTMFDGVLASRWSAHTKAHDAAVLAASAANAAAAKEADKAAAAAAAAAADLDAPGLDDGCCVTGGPSTHRAAAADSVGDLEQGLREVEVAPSMLAAPSTREPAAADTAGSQKHGSGPPVLMAAAEATLVTLENRMAA